MPDVSIERACDRDVPLALALLAPAAAHDALIFTARDREGNLLGVAGAGWLSWGKPPGFPIWVHVLPDRRREGIGLRLMKAIQHAVVGEVPGLWVATPIDTAGAAAAFATQAGFERTSRQFFFRADAKRFLQRMETITDRLLQHSRVPANATLTAPDQANIEAVSALVLSEVRGAPRRIYEDLRLSLDAAPATAPVDIGRSLVLNVDDRVIGALLVRRMPDGINTQIIVNTVAPSMRKGWANPFLIVSLVRKIVADSSEWFEFDCAEDIKDTIGLARRGEADCIRIDGLFRYAVTAADA